MRKYNPMTFDQHVEIGAELKRIRDFLIRLSCDVPRAYGKSKAVSRYAHKAFMAIDPLRSELENWCFRDCKDKAHIGIYYPDGPDSQSKGK